MINKSSKILTLAFAISASSYSFAAPIHDEVFTNDIGRIQKTIKEDPRQLYSLDDNGQTPIHIAIANNSIPGLKALLDNVSADLNVANQDNETPLVYAIKLNKYYPILFLLQKGANPYYTDKNGRDSLYYVKKFGDDSTKMIFDEVIKYQAENSKKVQNRNQQTTAAIPKFVTGKNGKKSVEDLIAENAVQRELLGQTAQQLAPNSNNENESEDDENSNNYLNRGRTPINNDGVKVTPVKSNGFVYKDDMEMTDEDSSPKNESSKDKEIQNLAAKVDLLTQMVKSKLTVEKKEPVIEEKVTPIPKNLTDGSFGYVETSVNADKEKKIQDFIKLNETIGNKVPEKYSGETEAPYSGIYRTQQKELSGTEKEVIPSNWTLESDDVNKAPVNDSKTTVNDTKVDTKEEIALPNKDSKVTDDISQEIEAIPNNEKNRIVESDKPSKKDILPEKVIYAASDIKPVGVLKTETTKELETKVNKESPKDIPEMIISKNSDMKSPVITEKQSENIEQKISNNIESNKNGRSTWINLLMAFLLASLAALSVFASYFGYNKYKEKKEKEIKENEVNKKESEEKRSDIKSRLVPSNSWNEKKPE